MTKGIVIGVALVALAIVAAIFLIRSRGSDEGAAAWWIVGFESDAPTHTGGWRRAEGSTCVWIEYEDGNNDDRYIQVPSAADEIALVSEQPFPFEGGDSLTIRLFFPRDGGQVEAFAGDSGTRSNDVFGRKVSVVPQLGPIPAAGLPDCEIPEGQ